MEAVRLSIVIESQSNFLIENVYQNSSKTYQVNRFWDVVVVLAHDFIVVWTPLSNVFVLFFKILQLINQGFRG